MLIAVVLSFPLIGGQTMNSQTVALEEAEKRKPDDAGSWSRVVLVALTLTVTLQVSRVFLPMVFNLGERSGTASSAVTAGALALIVFLAPVLTPLVRRSLGARGSVLATLGALVGLRIAIQTIHPVPLWLSTAAMVVALLGLTLLLLAMRNSWGTAGGYQFALGALSGLAIDTGFKSANWSWDYAWQEGVVPLVLAVALGAGVILALARQAGELSPPVEAGAGVLVASLVGPFLLLHVLFLQSAAFVSSSGHVSLPRAASVVLVGDAIGLLVALWIRGRQIGPLIRLVAGAALVILAYLLRQVGGREFISVVLAGHALAAGFFAMALMSSSGHVHDTTWRTSTAFAVGMLVFMLFLVLYQIGYRVALPFPNSILAPVAALILFVGGRRSSAASRIPGPTPLRLLVAMPLVLLLVPMGMVLTRGDQVTTAGDGSSFRLVSYNAHLGIDSDGQIDLEAVADVILEQHPDVVALQEVVRGWPGAGGLDLAEWLSHRLRMPYAYAPAADDQFGNVILSALPIRSAEGAFLPRATSAMRRSYLQTTIDIGRGNTMTVVDAHLEGGEPTLSLQVERLLRAVAGKANTVVVGDLNMQPDNPNRAKFDAADLASAQDLAGQSAQSTAAKPKFPGDRVDWIFGTSDLTFSSFQIGRRTTSDHRPLWVTVRPRTR
jgi:endonuclease/exonuclease/phosphatase family metal-dependent hydrolase